MDEKKDGAYPVYLITEEYGIRGLDYRAPGNPNGILMLIVSQFSDPRTRIQALRRICRYSDSGMYIVNDIHDTINRDKFIELKGKIAVAEKGVEKVLKQRNKPKEEKKSKAQVREERPTMRVAMNNDQVRVLEGKSSLPEDTKMMVNMGKCREQKFSEKKKKGIDYAKDKFEEMSDEGKVEILRSTDV